MNMTFWDHFQNIIEWTIVAILIIGGVSLFFAEPVSSAGPITQLLGSRAAAVVYGFTFCFEGVALAYAKARRMKKFHKNILLAIYLTAIFVLILEVVLVGFGPGLLDQFLLFLASGWAWLRWKFKTEYLDPSEIYAEAHDLREDIPDKPRY